MRPKERERLEKEISKWEDGLRAATDTGIARWIGYHLVLLRRQLEELDGNQH